MLFVFLNWEFHLTCPLVVVVGMWWSVGGAEDADVDGGGVDVQEFLHHNGNVSIDAVLRIHRRHPVWLR